MASRWPEPLFQGDDTDNPVELANQFQAYYQDVFMHTLKNPTAAAPARYVVDIMFQANKIMTLLKGEVAGMSLHAITSDEPCLPDTVKLENAGEAPLSDTYPEQCQYGPTYADMQGGALPEEIACDSNGLDEPVEFVAEQARKNDDPQPLAESREISNDPWTELFEWDKRQSHHSDDRGDDATAKEEPVEHKSVEDDHYNHEYLDSEEDDSDWDPSDSDEETDDEFYEYNEESEEESADEFEGADESQEPEKPVETDNLNNEEAGDEVEQMSPTIELATCSQMDHRVSGGKLAPKLRNDTRNDSDHGANTYDTLAGAKESI